MENILHSTPKQDYFSHLENKLCTWHKLDFFIDNHSGVIGLNATMLCRYVCTFIDNLNETVKKPRAYFRGERNSLAWEYYEGYFPFSKDYQLI